MIRRAARSLSGRYGGWRVLITLGVLVTVFPLGSAALPTAPHTWEGTWDTSTDSGAPDPPGGTMSIRADGSGSYKNCLGKIEGKASGNTLKGTWTHRGPCMDAVERSGPFELTMDASGKHFTGRWGYASGTGGWIGNWNGVCVKGKCLANGSAPSPATTTTPTTTTPATGKTIRRFVWAVDSLSRYESTVEWKIEGYTARYHVLLNRQQGVGLFTYSAKAKKVTKASGTLTDTTLFNRIGPPGKPPSPLTVKRVLVLRVVKAEARDLSGFETPPSREIHADLRVKSDSSLKCKPGTWWSMRLKDSKSSKQPDYFEMSDKYDAGIQCLLGARPVIKGTTHEKQGGHRRVVIRERKG